LAEDPRSRVACETMVTTGLVHVAGEVTTEGYVEIPRIVRKRSTAIGYDSSFKGFDGNSCGVSVSIGSRARTSPRASTTPKRSAHRHRRSTPARQAGRRRPGADVRLRLRRHRRVDAAADLLGAPARRAADRGAQGRDVRYLRPDGKTQVTFEYEVTAGPPGHGRHLDQHN
jgi:S-adenosylmethionine synthetase